MTYAYSTGPRRRLVLGPPHAPTRLCVPIPQAVYDAVAALPERDQGLFVEILGEFLGHVMQTWPEPIPAPARETAAAEEAAPEESGDWDRGVRL